MFTDSHYIKTAYHGFRVIYPLRNISPVFRHSLKVFQLVRNLGKQVSVDVETLYFGAMLHDLGRLADTTHPMLHGIEGERLILTHHFFDFLPPLIRSNVSRICRNHIGCGIMEDDIRVQKLPLPETQYVPETLEELLVSFADNLCYGETFKGINHATERFSRELGEDYGKRVLAQADSISAMGIDLTLYY